MTLVDHRPAESESQQAEVLFREARQRRRRRRRLTVGITLLVVVVGSGGLLATRGHAGRTNLALPRSRPPPGSSSPPSRASVTTATLKGPEALAVASDGGVLIDERASNQIVEREPNGHFKVIVGNGRAGFSGDGGPATSSEINDPAAMAVSPSGTVYIADLGNDRIRSVDRTGSITTVVKVEQPSALALGPGGALFVVDQAGVQKLGSGGALTTVVSPTHVTFPEGTADEVSFAGSSFAFDPDAIAVSGSGDIYVSNFSPKVLIRFPPVGPPSLVGQSSVGSSEIYVTPAALAANVDGSVIVGNYGTFAIDRVMGLTITVIKPFASRSVPGLGGVFRPSGVAVAPNGEIYAATDGENGGTRIPALLSIDPDGEAHLLNKGIAATKSGP
jgi:serine/threonine protein kinase, bacterial